MVNSFSYTKGVFFDCLFLAIIVILSLFLYVPHLGFYSDDWAFLGTFTHMPHDSFFSFIKDMFFPQGHSSEFQSALMRPVQLLYLAGLYFMFELYSFGYHLTNSFVMVCIPILFYLTLRYLHLPRFISLTVPLMYILLPNYSTDRFWIAAFQINISMFFYFLSLYAGLLAVYEKKRNAMWGILSIVGLLISTLSYEVVMPLFFVNIILFSKYFSETFLKETKRSANIATLLTISTITLLAGIFLFKALITTRIGEGPFQGIYEYLIYVIYIVINASWINFISLGAKLPFTIGSILKEYFNLFYLLISLVIGGAIYFYLSFMSSVEKVSKPYWFSLISIGFLIFFLGYAIFFINNNISFSVYGIANRIAIAASIGVAMVFVGGIGVLSGFISDVKKRNIFFSFLIAFVCAGNVLVIQTLSSFWISAYQFEKTILSDMYVTVPKIGPHTSIFLDGICPYIGPAVVFESNWDFRGTLKVMYRDSTIRADVVTDRLSIKKDGLYTKIYDQTTHYPYGNQTLIYNFAKKQIFTMSSYQAAEKYFKNHHMSCPQGREGHGVSIF